jgi:hypothetical protein
VGPKNHIKLTTYSPFSEQFRNQQRYEKCERYRTPLVHKNLTISDADPGVLCRTGILDPQFFPQIKGQKDPGSIRIKEFKYF